MESDTNSLKIETLNELNYSSWKIRIQHVLALKDLEDFLEDDPPTDTSQSAIWLKKDKKARAIIGLTLSNEMLENVREAKTAKDMWNTIKNVFERHTLLNKLSARRKFYTAEKQENEGVLKFSNRIRQLASVLKDMAVDISESEMSMALLNGLPEEYKSIITALDALNETELDWEHVKARLLQEEQRINMRNKTALEKSEAQALVSNQHTHEKHQNCKHCFHAKSRPVCDHCGKPGHVSSKCWDKFPHLKPRFRKKNSNQSALIASQSEEDPVVCLMADCDKSSESKKSESWFIDSGCSNHMTHDKSIFTSYTSGYHSSVELGNSNTASVHGKGTVEIKIIVDRQQKTCRLSNVLHVPEL